MKKYFIFLVINFFLLFIDRFSKILSILKLKNNSSFIIIKDFLSLEYVKNTGGAWGILEKYTFILIIISTIFIFLCSIIYFRLCFISSYKLLKISLLLVISGAIGNLYDRIRYGYVIDFISFDFIKFPVFNISDIFITIGIILIIILIFFIYKKEDLSIIEKSIKLK